MKSKIYLSLLFVGIALSVFSQKKELQSITENDLQAHLEFIASDYLQGRELETAVPGLEITADYLKAQCKKMGLKPGADNYFQEVEMISIKPDYENSFIEIIDNEVVSYKDKNIIVYANLAENETIKGEMVFVGYGWSNKKSGYDDLDGVDLKNKIAVLMTRNREQALDTTKKSEDIEWIKVKRIFKAGAKAMLVFPDPLNPDKMWFDMVRDYSFDGSIELKINNGPSFFPGNIIIGTEVLADKIVNETGKTLLQLQEEINKTGTPKSFPIKKHSAKIQLTKKLKLVTDKNVIAIVEGSDPVLKNECVVLTAHYDHLGIDKNGEVFNGADDNGSGTVALLEIAEAFTKMKKSPKRSIVFVWVTCEEKGLLGSNYYSQHPVISLDKTLVDINLDMVGRAAKTEITGDVKLNNSLTGPNGLYVVTGGQSSELTAISNKICKSLNLVPNDGITKEILNRSDYYNFYKNGIPVLGLTTGLHEDYHKVTDELDKIDYNKMMRVSKYCFLVANEVANKKKRIVVDKPVSK